jgi:sulfur relay (sulfurtransferase) complex TusBCD TusD component (DsrE family)
MAVFNGRAMSLENKKLGLLLSASPEQPNFDRAIALATAALKNGVQVYFYCIDEAVAGLDRPQLQALKQSGVKLFACAFGAQRRQLSLGDLATFAGLSTVSDLIANTDRFVSFN